MKQRSFKEVLHKLLLFSLTAMAGTIVDLVLHWILVKYAFEGNYWGSFWIAPAVSFEVSTLVNFVIAFHFVWKERLTNTGSRAFWRHFAAFNAAGIGAFLLKFAVMQGVHFIFVSLAWMQDTTYEPVVCNMIGLCFSGLFNFIMSEFFIFDIKGRESAAGNDTVSSDMPQNKDTEQ